MNREELIEAARVAYVEAWEAKRKEIGRGIAEPGAKSRAGIQAALAVFEQAHTPTTPTDDEREALIDVMVMTKLSDYAATDMSTIHQAVDAILAAGFRRTVQGEPTDAQVEHMRRVLNDADIDYSAREQRADAGGGEMEPGDWFTFLARAALRAAAATQEGENRG